ncbi:MAG TPA: hypothetical protein VMW42_05175 [Desulfatiglandales bacterium]|nr:hypothetical protein [Desulfatiglandales bacterium]
MAILIKNLRDIDLNPERRETIKAALRLAAWRAKESFQEYGLFHSYDNMKPFAAIGPRAWKKINHA